MTQVNATAKCYAYISSSWVELDDAGGARALRYSWGMPGNSPLDLIADIGELSIALNNSTGQYTPGGPSALAGWKKGIPFKLEYTFEGETYIRFRGFVTGIDIRPGIKDKLCYVTVEDWLSYAQKHPVVNPSVAANQTGDQVITTVVGLVEVAPQATDYDTGIETFPSVFDATTTNTRVYNELSKVAFSELGHVYLKKDKANGETLVFEAQDARPGSKTVDTFPIASADSGAMLKEDTGYLLLETGGKILLNQTAATAFTSANIQDFDAPYGEHVINRMTVNIPQRRYSASPEVLFNLDKEIKIGSGKSRTIKGNYADPQGGLPINAQDVVTPVATTDFTAFTATGGGGSNITADIDITITKGAEGFTAVLTNTNTSKAFINFFQVRGTGIYKYNPIEHTAENAASIGGYETDSETLHQKYQDTIYSGAVFVDSVVEEHSQPRTVLNSITFVANRSAGAMTAFLRGDVGQLHYIDIDELGITGNYYIQGIEVNMNGRIITVTWILVAALSIQSGCGLTPLAVEFGGTDAEDYVNYGHLPRAYSDSSPETISASAWIYPALLETTHYILSFSEDNGGLFFYVDELLTGERRLYVTNSEYVDGGSWRTVDISADLTLNAWHHVAFTYDMSSGANDPVIYLDGTSRAFTETDAPSSAQRYGKTPAYVIWGNIFTSTKTPTTNGFDGKIFDPRIFDYIISASDVLTLYNGGTPSASVGPSNMVLHGFNARTENTANYIGQTLTSDTKLFEAQFKAVGVPGGAPVGRAAP